MKHIALTLVALSLFVGQTASGATLEEVVQAESVTLEDLGVEDAGLLPTSPFYVFKEIGRGVRTLFTFNDVKKAELEVKFANEKAAEAKIVVEREPENEEAAERAVANYRETAERLRIRLEEVSATSENPNVDRLLDSVAERAVQHEKLFAELQERFEDGALVKEELELVRERVAEAVAKAAEKDSPEKLKERLRRVLDKETGELRDLRSVEIVEGFAAKLSDEQKERLGELREELADRLADRIEDAADQDEEIALRLEEAFSRIPGDELSRAKIVKELRLRVSDNAVRHLERVETELDSRALENAERLKERAQEQGEKAQEAVEKLERALEETPAPAASELLSQAKRHLEAARAAFAEEKYGEAFGQATSAQANALNGLRIVSKEKEAGELDREARERFEEEKRDIQLRLDTEQLRVQERLKEARRKLEERVVCTLEFSPVCGADGNTYANRCVAERQRDVKVAHEGKCEDASRSAPSTLPSEKQPEALDDRLRERVPSFPVDVRVETE